MSKQINYFMDKETEERFIQFVQDTGFYFIDWNDGKIVNPYEEKKLFYYIISEKYIKLLEYKNDTVDSLNCLVIEYIRNNIIEEKKIITRGRIYISNAYKDERFFNYSGEFLKDYNMLYKWIKKNVPCQNYSSRGVIQKEYISDSMLVYSEKEYFFQA